MLTNLDDFFECEFFEGEVDCDEWVNAHCTIIGVKNAADLPIDLDIPCRIDDDYIVTEIGDRAFMGLHNLRSVKIPGSVTSIGVGAFAECNNLYRVKISDGVTTIGADAFYGCNSLSEVYFDDVNSLCQLYLGNKFSNPMTFAKQIYIGGELLGDCITIPATLQSTYYDATIKEYTFSGCHIKTLRFEDGITKLDIEAHAFDGCAELTTVILPDSLKRLKASGLLDCKNINWSDYNGLKYLGSESNPYKMLLGAFDELPAYITHPDTEVICQKAFAGHSKLVKIKITEGVSTIESSCFAHCINLKRVYLPSSLNNVRSDAFEGCKSIEEVHISDLSSWCNISFAASFIGCKSNPLGASKSAKLYRGDNIPIENLTMPQGITEVPWHTFCGYKFLKSVTFPEGLTTVSGEAFAGCTSLESVYFPSSLKQIGTLAFADCFALKNMILPDNIEAIGNSAFLNCTSLKFADIPAVKLLDYSAFSGCTSLESVHFSGKMKSIENGTFANCSALKSIDIPYGVTKIERGAFIGCTALSHVSLPRTLKEIGYEAFNGCTSLTEVEIPEAVDDIGCKAFCCCSKLKKVKFLTKKVFYINSHAFAGCESLESIVLPEHVYSLLNGAFEECSSLQRVEMPKTVSHIGRDIFRSCSKSLEIIASDEVMTMLKNADSH